MNADSPEEEALVPGIARRVWARLTGWVTPWRDRRRAVRTTQLPAWAKARRRRRAHIRRVVSLLEEWADEMEVSKAERARWVAAAWLHDALRDAKLPAGASHGEAAADRAAHDGVADPGVLDAVRHHSVGYAGWDDVGKMLYLADNLEPGRKGRRKQRAKMAKRVPRERDAVLRELLGRQIQARVRAGRSIDPRTLEFWNSLAQR